MMDSFFSDFSIENNFSEKIGEISEGSWSLELSTGSVNPEDVKIAVDYENKNFEISGTEKVKKTLFDGSTLTSAQEFQRIFQEMLLRYINYFKFDSKLSILQIYFKNLTHQAPGKLRRKITDSENY